MKDLLSVKGRLNRKAYFLRTGILGALGEFLLKFPEVLKIQISSLLEWICILITIALLIIIAFQVVKRLHDIEKPDWHYWLLFVPLYNVYLGLILLFQKGTDGPNLYGDDPLQKI